MNLWELLLKVKVQWFLHSPFVSGRSGIGSQFLDNLAVGVTVQLRKQ